MSAAIQIANLVKLKLEGRQIDVVGFIDGLLTIAKDVGEIRCRLAGDRGLRFDIGDQDACEVQLDSSRSKLRMLCARLGVLCNETGAVPLYGGEGMIHSQSQWTIRFKNTPAEQEFTIVDPNLKQA